MKTYCKGLELTRRSVVEALHRWKKSDSGKENGWRVADEYGTETAFVDRIWLELSTETLTHLVRSRAPGRLAKEALETTATRVRALHAQAHRALGEARVLLLGLAENGCHGAPDERQAVHIQRGEGRGLGGEIWL